jgi:glutamate-ammonia-ligase adenylyltransferase
MPERDAVPPPLAGPARAANAEAAARAMATLLEAAPPALHAVLADARHQPLLHAMLGSSPHLAELARREPATLAFMLDHGFAPAFERVLEDLAKLPPATPRDKLGAALRTAKRRGSLVIAAADVARAWNVPAVCRAITSLAEATLCAAAAHLLLATHQAGRLALPDPANPAQGSGLIVLGMGKLGAGELNYSSDIDLIVLFDHAAAVYRGDDIQGCYVRIARDLVKLMEERTEGGYVFRTDLRLRPDPAATPLALSTDAAAAYYGSLGQNWERAAMIKARAVAGDIEAGGKFLAELRPWVWRRHLDFAAIRDIHAMRRQIISHKLAKNGGGAEVGVAGHDVKLGRGGIREIEFFAQTQQLVWGGRLPGLRTPRTLDALAALADSGKIPAATAENLSESYAFLRIVEHRLQMLEDRQTHKLPEDEPGLDRLAAFLGFAHRAAFAEALLFHLRRVEAAYSDAVEAGPKLGAPDAANGGSLVFTGKGFDPDTIATLARMGFAKPEAVDAQVRGWHHGRYRATRTPRAREILTELAPALLAALGRQPDADAAFTRFDAFLANLSAGVQLLSLLRRNPALLERLARLFGAAPGLADLVAQHPAVLDGFLAGGAPEDDPAVALAPLLADATHFEAALDALRRFAAERNLAIAIAELDGTLGTDAAGRARTAVAEACLAALLPRVEADFAERHGRIPGGQFAVLGLGKLGAREMLAGSDLDLIMVYAHDDAAEASDGPPSSGARRLDPVTYFARLAARLVAAITAPTAAGKLYEVDMRLRPTGNKGPIAVQLDGFTRYHAQESWTWERMALTRARVVAGPPDFARRIDAVLRDVLTRPGDASRIRADAAAMRARIAESFPPDDAWDVKHRHGGLMEVEFIAQALQLAHAPAHPEVLSPNTGAALAALAEAGALPPATAQALGDAARRWRAISSGLRLVVGDRRRRDPPGPAAQAALARMVFGRAASDAPETLAVALSGTMDSDARAVRSAFMAHICGA